MCKDLQACAERMKKTKAEIIEREKQLKKLRAEKNHQNYIDNLLNEIEKKQRKYFKQCMTELLDIFRTNPKWKKFLINNFNPNRQNKAVEETKTRFYFSQLLNPEQHAQLQERLNAKKRLTVLQIQEQERRSRMSNFFSPKPFYQRRSIHIPHDLTDDEDDFIYENIEFDSNDWESSIREMSKFRYLCRFSNKS